MSQHLKPMPDNPMGGFLLNEFKKFAKGWATQNDLDRIGISLASNGYPVVWNSDLLPALFWAAAFPSRLKDATEESHAFLVAYRRSPDFVLALLTHLRAKLAKAKPHRRLLLYGEAKDMGPGEIARAMNGPDSVSKETAKAERRKMRTIASNLAKQKNSKAVNNELQDSVSRLIAAFPDKPEATNQ